MNKRKTKQDSKNDIMNGGSLNSYFYPQPEEEALELESDIALGEIIECQVTAEDKARRDKAIREI